MLNFKKFLKIYKLLNSKNTKLNPNFAYSLVEISIVILVIGILIAGITNGMDLYRDYRVEMAKQITQKSRVATMKNLVLWFESSQKSSFEPKNIGSETKITKWKNITPNLFGKLDADLVSGASGPIYRENIHSSLSGIYFTKDENNCLSVPAGYDSGSTENSAFILLKLDKANTDNTRILSTWNSSRQYWYELRHNAWGSGYADGASNFLINVAVSNNGDYSKNKAELINYQQKPDLIKLYLNKSLQPDPTSYSAPSYSYQGAQLTIGCKLGVGTGYPSAYILELIVFDRYLKDNERKIVEDYLYKKWNL